MRQSGSTRILFALLLGAMSGCGTMLNMDGKEKLDFGGSDLADDQVYVMKYQRPAFPFGGLANDLAWIKSASEPADVVLCLADMPFSLVGDIVTLPWAIHEALIGRPAAKETTSPTDPAAPK